MKIAISGKGGTGKTTLAAILAHLFAADGYKVLAVDADPDANLAAALGIPPELRAQMKPISEQRRLIKERTGANPRQFGQLFKINPTVEDIPDDFSLRFQGVKLLVLGAVRKGGEGCACPENVLLKNLLSEIILHREEAVIVDMEAGIEHLGRATAKGIEKMLIVVEPGSRSVDSAKMIIKLGKEIGLQNFGIVGNKIQTTQQADWIQSHFDAETLLGMISYSPSIQDADLKQLPLFESLDERSLEQFRNIYRELLKPGNTP
jgi:CO dehydrogenase maturation factor